MARCGGDLVFEENHGIVGGGGGGDGDGGDGALLMTVAVAHVDAYNVKVVVSTPCTLVW